MAFMILALCHPFIGKKVQAPDENGGGWDAEPAGDGAPAIWTSKRTLAIYHLSTMKTTIPILPTLPVCPANWSRRQNYSRLFQETLGVGRKIPTAAQRWHSGTLKLAKAADLSLTCPSCNMSYFRSQPTKNVRTAKRRAPHSYAQKRIVGRCCSLWEPRSIYPTDYFAHFRLRTTTTQNTRRSWTSLKKLRCPFEERARFLMVCALNLLRRWNEIYGIIPGQIINIRVNTTEPNTKRLKEQPVLSVSASLPRSRANLKSNSKTLSYLSSQP